MINKNLLGESLLSFLNSKDKVKLFLILSLKQFTYKGELKNKFEFKSSDFKQNYFIDDLINDFEDKNLIVKKDIVHLNDLDFEVLKCIEKDKIKSNQTFYFTTNFFKEIFQSNKNFIMSLVHNFNLFSFIENLKIRYEEIIFYKNQIREMEDKTFFRNVLYCKDILVKTKRYREFEKIKIGFNNNLVLEKKELTLFEKQKLREKIIEKGQDNHIKNLLRLQDFKYQRKEAEEDFKKGFVGINENLSNEIKRSCEISTLNLLGVEE